MNGDLLVSGTIQGDLSQNFVAGDNITMTQDDTTKVITISSSSNLNTNTTAIATNATAIATNTTAVSYTHLTLPTN